VTQATEPQVAASAAQTAAASETAMIELRKLTKAFGSNYALRGVSLRVMPGESLVIFGPNGAGKSTLIRILSSLSRPTSGTVRIGGLDLASHADGIRRHLGVVSHAPLLYDSLTAEENLRFFAGLYGMPHPEPRIAAMLAQVGLTSRRADLVRTFSRGMVQRLAIARALLHDPQVLLLDEPDTGLDPQAAEMLHDLLVAVSRGQETGDRRQATGIRSQGTGGREADRPGNGGNAPGDALPHAGTPAQTLSQRTLVTVTHSLERGLAIADRVVILANGQLVFESEIGNMTAADFRPLYDKYVGGRP
jgi:heme exporter protein A